jgi:hypothetical protein
VKRLIALVLVVLALSGCGTAVAANPTAVWKSAAPSPDVPDINDNGASLPPPDSPSPSPSPSPSKKTHKPSPSATPSHKPSATPNVLVTWGTSFSVAPGGTGVVGSGKTLQRYEVAVQNGLSESPAGVASTVDSVLDNQVRGWLRGGDWRFQRVSSGPYDFVVELATPSTTDYICGKYGIHTAGEVSCRGLKNVVINLTRWEHGTNGTTEGGLTAYAPADYRILVINHEVGHALGHQHEKCPATGQLAPVMMTSFYGLDGCLPNLWPYAADGTEITGPLV